MGEIFISVLLPLAVVIIMFCLGLGLTAADFQRIGRRPRAFCVGALNQIIFLPCIALMVILVFGISSETAVGIMILAACPGGAISNIVTKLSNWDVALSVTLTAVFSLTCVLTVPLILGFSMQLFMGSAAPAVDISSTVLAMFLWTVAPILAGVTVRSAASQTIADIEPVFSKISMLLFAVVVGGAIISNWGVVAENYLRLGPALFSVGALLTLTGVMSSRLLGCTDVEAKTISIETGVQNGALGIAIATLLLPGTDELSAYAIPSAIYSVVWIVTVLPVFAFLARRSPIS
ncbi:bile acid:sodium symporter family protein [Ruegeria sp. R13_0]|uniref:bile acid:sodium symporter family protein n=1 Tax=Ruegeria sp. R13_0 TaxID=2821099 RepID=UPI001ADCB844|nr:bile acid:sodium symporter [Ruegeria sp. R13_0]MBO9436723.1 bile acid:sodium symporter family protein [Ruegeria sp. R13_0]